MPGGLDLLVNNAGLGDYAEFADQDSGRDPPDHRGQPDRPDRLDAESRAPHEGPGHGQILQISSVLGFVGMPYSAVYVASKHAVNGLVKSLATSCDGTGVRVWAACPGRTESEFVARGDRCDRSSGPVRPQGGADGQESSGRSSAGSTAGRPHSFDAELHRRDRRALAAGFPGPFEWRIASGRRVTSGASWNVTRSTPGGSTEANPLRPSAP